MLGERGWWDAVTEALVLTGPQELKILPRTARPLGRGEVRLRVDAAGICGSDVHGYAGLNDRRPVGVVMGHETIGTVIETSADALTVGTRVAVNPVVACGVCDQCLAHRDNLCLRRRLYGCCLELEGGLATEMVVSGGNCVAVDAEANIIGLALIEPMAVGMHSVQLASVGGDHRIVVLGGGPIGIAVALACRDADASAVISEPSRDRRDVAEGLGITTCAPEELRAREAKFDLAFECVGSTRTVHDAIASVRPGGTIVCLGLAEASVEIPAAQLVVQERRMFGSSAYTHDDFVRTAHRVSVQAEKLANLVQRTVTLDDMPQVFADYHAGRLSAMKTLYVRDGQSI